MPSINMGRLIDIAIMAIDGLIQDDRTEAMIYLRDTMELTEDECELFGIDYKEMKGETLCLEI